MNRDAASPILPQSALSQIAAANTQKAQDGAASIAQQLSLNSLSLGQVGGLLNFTPGGGMGGSTRDSVSSVSTAQGFTQMPLPLSATLMRNLGDRSYDKRKGAALELENLIKQLQENALAVEHQQALQRQKQEQQMLQNEEDTSKGINGTNHGPAIDKSHIVLQNPSRQRIPAIIELLGNDFACSKNANHRKGGLIGLAATAIGLMHNAHLYLDKLLPPVLHCFEDPESRVRYYACESLYNIAKVARGHILVYFNSIFDGLCKLFADVDVDVKNGANLLDRLVKDIVTESEYFDVDLFIPLLNKYIRMTNPYIRQLLVGWITVLDSVPDIDMLDWLPEFLDGLFNMLSDGNREIRQAADSALSEFLKSIKTTENVDFGRMVTILVGQCNSKERFNRLTAATWVHEFVNLGKEKLVEFYAPLLGAIMHCISDPEHEIRQVADRANDDLLTLVRETTETIDIVGLMAKLSSELECDHIPTRMATLRWISMLLEKNPDELAQQIGTLLPTLLLRLSDVSDAVVLLDLEVLARISLNPSLFERVLHSVVQLFATDRRLLETRGSMIVRKLCVLLDCKSIYMVFAKVLASETIISPDDNKLTSSSSAVSEITTPMDVEFASVMVQTLNLILLTANELDQLRDVLRRSFQDDATEEDIVVFTALFQTWCHNPIAVFSLCLLAQSYSLSCALISQFANIDASVGFLLQVDKLVQLLESPIFIHMRLQLLELQDPCHSELVKSLYGLLMLLPQSAAFRVLRDRLTSVTNMATTIGHSQANTYAVPEKKTKKKDDDKANSKKDKSATVAQLLEHFKSVQQKHVDIRKQSK